MVTCPLSFMPRDKTLDDELVSALRLMRSENLGIKTFHSLIELFGTASKALEELPDLLNKKAPRGKIKICPEDKALAEIERIEKFGARLLYFKDSLYPKLLKSIPDFPPLLTIYGKNDSLLSKDKVAVVGSRNASSNSSRFTQKISRELGERSYVVVSGLARGIDANAHTAAIRTGTIAVVAGGVDNIYPSENERLYKEIAEEGIIISENLLGASPKAQNFPQRNRIVSGLSLATIVIEASVKSGSLITANFALEQDREVFAVPGFPLDHHYSGTNLLIKQGAHLFSRVEDLVDVFNMDYKKQEDLFEYKCNKPEEVPACDKQVCKKDLDKVRELILSKLGTSPISLDDLIYDTKISRDIVLLVVVELELDDLVRRIGNNVSLVVS